MNINSNNKKKEREREEKLYEKITLKSFIIVIIVGIQII